MSRPCRWSGACDLCVRASESGVSARSVQSSWLACLVCLVYLLCLVHLQCVHVCGYVCGYVCACGCVYVCACVCLCVCM